MPEVALAVTAEVDDANDAIAVGLTAMVEETAVGAACDVPVRD